MGLRLGALLFSLSPSHNMTGLPLFFFWVAFWEQCLGFHLRFSTVSTRFWLHPPDTALRRAGLGLQGPSILTNITGTHDKQPCQVSRPSFAAREQAAQIADRRSLGMEISAISTNNG